MFPRVWGLITDNNIDEGILQHIAMDFIWVEEVKGVDYRTQLGARKEIPLL